MVSASLEIAAGPGLVFELIADAARQPRWDGDDNLAGTPAGQRVHRTGDVFLTTPTHGGIRENHVVEFEEGHRIAWQPSRVGAAAARHLWRWELGPASRPAGDLGRDRHLFLRGQDQHPVLGGPGISRGGDRVQRGIMDRRNAHLPRDDGVSPGIRGFRGAEVDLVSARFADGEVQPIEEASSTTTAHRAP